MHFDNFLEFQTWWYKEVLLVLPYFSHVCHGSWTKDRQVLQSLVVVNENICILIQFSLKFVQINKGTINNKALTEPVMAYFTDAYMLHPNLMSKTFLVSLKMC